ncbi:nucleotidyltransferase domain-containing protein [Brevibacterium sp. CT2-23B]|uniref:aminoglycoside adenylyltransferase domain-containing protein n=1 Tax=Brevibacterium sp. CT2-23B TaxID=2729630 RepID=UPI0015568485|nr:nucleotidyltransferase domain-containing protein [Brevibacterium sp. CT2-23B]
MSAPLPPDAATAIRSYLRAADRILPGGVIACAVTGSIALGAYRPGRSDIDLVAVIADEWLDRPDLIRRLRLLHLSQVPRLVVETARGRGVSACCNTVFIAESEVSRPVTEIRPIASHTGEIFDAHGAFDVNPVIWRELVDGGITVRGRPIAAWDLDAQPEALRPWVRTNLREYWTPLAAQLRDRPQRTPRTLVHRLLTSPRGLSAGTVAWCVLGPARMHHTLATGEIIGKEAAGRHALDAFPQHAPITEVALAKVRGARIPSAPSRAQWRALTASAMEDMITASLG